ncbi:LysR family transcriptional regulator [Paraburkholderia hospita]|uniref:LysR family transcriptional regulator n=1 Tax=Paraburkholderia hospita TaxID=169430 RepID=UPI0002719D7E|nr:LysR family transcriptional regulator [Paraburkholderia hospita]EUC19184.1 transcriptional regulator, LysR family [Burkholderia sp. BT03]SKC62718.1 transcriptional regulator, LysR family [Paraburkholderia hospita]
MSTDYQSTTRRLDLDDVQAFVLVADLSSFTRAAEVLDITQSSISLKMKRLEERLGRRLLERTPRRVQLLPEGAAFLAAARELLSAHDRALNPTVQAQRSLRLGIIDHTAADGLIPLIARISAQDPTLRVEVKIGASSEMLAGYDAGELDAVFARRDATRRDAEKLFVEHCGWFASPQWTHSPGEPLRIASLSAPCGVRANALKALDEAGIKWTEVFVGGGIGTVGAAVMAGLAVAPMTRRGCPPRAVDVGSRLGLPPLAPIEIAVYTRVRDASMRETIRSLGAALRTTNASA